MRKVLQSQNMRQKSWGKGFGGQRVKFHILECSFYSNSSHMWDLGREEGEKTHVSEPTRPTIPTIPTESSVAPIPTPEITESTPVPHTEPS